MGNTASATTKKLRNPKRHLKHLEELPGQFESGFPESPGGNKNWYWKLPSMDKLAEGGKARRELQRAGVQALVDIAAKLIRNKPPQHRDARVVAWISLPDLAMSSVAVFYRAAALKARVEDAASVAAGRSLIRELDLKTQLPERGYGDSYEAKGQEHPFETWIIGEVE